MKTEMNKTDKAVYTILVFTFIVPVIFFGHWSIGKARENHRLYGNSNLVVEASYPLPYNYVITTNWPSGKRDQWIFVKPSLMKTAFSNDLIQVVVSLEHPSVDWFLIRNGIIIKNDRGILDDAINLSVKPDNQPEKDNHGMVFASIAHTKPGKAILEYRFDAVATIGGVFGYTVGGGILGIVLVVVMTAVITIGSVLWGKIWEPKSSVVDC